MANTAVELLAGPAIVDSLRQAEDQWAYLAAVLKRALTAQIGAFFREDEMEFLAERVADERRDDVTPVVDAVKLTARFLAAHTTDDVLPHLEELVYYFAERGHANLSHLHTDAARDPELLSRGLRPKEIRAVANAVLGSRPDHGENSLLGAILLDSSWDPSTSAAHSAALRKYAGRLAGQRELVRK